MVYEWYPHTICNDCESGENQNDSVNISFTELMEIHPYTSAISEF